MEVAEGKGKGVLGRLLSPYAEGRRLRFEI